MVARTAALFDVDGTLVDTTHLHAVTWWEACRQAGHTVPMRLVHRAVGMGSDKLLDHLLPADRDRDADEGMVRAHAALYAEYGKRLTPLPGARELLRACAGSGRTVVLASSASGPELAALRAALDSEDIIEAATAGDDVDQSKPAPDLVREALRLSGAAPQEAVFVGDAVWDVDAAQRADVPCVAVATGAYGPEELRKAGAREVYRDAHELLATPSSILLDR
jgi:HAD superfamily hydrolase (TIGR01509 family)